MQRFWHRKRWNIAITGHFPQQQFSPRLEFRVKKVPQKRFLYATCTHIELQTLLFGGKLPNRKSITNASHTVKKSHFASSVSWSPCWKIVAKKVTDNQPIESYGYSIFIGTWIDFTFLTNRQKVVIRPHKQQVKTPWAAHSHTKQWFSSVPLQHKLTWITSNKVKMPFCMLFHMRPIPSKSDHNFAREKTVSTSMSFAGKIIPYDHTVWETT